MSTPELSGCAGFECGRAVCKEYCRAHKTQEMWQVKAGALTSPLSVVTRSSISSAEHSPGWLLRPRSLSRHNWETSSCPFAVPSLDEEAEAYFDWDRELPVFERMRQALVVMRTTMEQYGTVGGS